MRPTYKLYDGTNLTGISYSTDAASIALCPNFSGLQNGTVSTVHQKDLQVLFQAAQTSGGALDINDKLELQGRLGDNAPWYTLGTILQSDFAAEPSGKTAGKLVSCYGAQLRVKCTSVSGEKFAAWVTE